MPPSPWQGPQTLASKTGCLHCRQPCPSSSQPLLRDLNKASFMYLTELLPSDTSPGTPPGPLRASGRKGSRLGLG